VSSLSTPEDRAVDPDALGQLLVLVDPTARRADGESVRIARDVLCGGADVKVALPESPSELDRVLAHRGRRRPVVIGSDLALQRVLQALHRQRELGTDPVGLVPVGRPEEVATGRSLGVPAQPVVAARAVLHGAARKLDLLVDDGGGVVFGGVSIHAHSTGRASGLRSLWAKLAAAEQATPLGSEEPRLRVEADGRLLVDLDEPVLRLQAALSAGSGEMELLLQLARGPRTVRATRLAVTGRGFGYQADGCRVGPVRGRVWTVHPGVWQLLLPLA
jgi:hypothetical protein